MRLFSDQKRLLLTSYQATSARTSDATADEAIGQAYRMIGQLSSWSYLHRRTQLHTVAPQSTGSIAYDNTTRMMTLTGATWPSWTNQALILLGAQVYAVQQKIDSTHVLLSPSRNPGADVDAGTVYQIICSEYVLPDDFTRVEEFVPIGQIWPLREVAAGSMLELARLFSRPCRPWMFLTRGSNYFAGKMAIEFGPPPDQAYTFDLSYYATPRKRTLASEVSTGTVSVSGTAVTGVGTGFTSSMVGCRLRQGTSAAVPVGEYGASGSINENTIASVEDTTHLTLVDAGATSSGVKYVIDDPVDIERGSMDEVFTRLCEFQFEMLIHGDKRVEKERDYITALQRARAMDVRLAPGQPANFIPSLEALAYANLRGR